MPAPNAPLPEDDLLFLLLRQLEAAPEASQRATAEALEISLGRLNAILRAATEATIAASGASGMTIPPTVIGKAA